MVEVDRGGIILFMSYSTLVVVSFPRMYLLKLSPAGRRSSIKHDIRLDLFFSYGGSGYSKALDIFRHQITSRLAF
jgi:hypothetical protein